MLAITSNNSASVIVGLSVLLFTTQNWDSYEVVIPLARI